jgi:short-subunit dehydrogenase
MSYALITGGSKGIGRAMAYHLAKKKLNLLLVARSESLLKEVSIELRNKFPIDVRYLCIDLAGENAAEIIFEWVTAENIPVNILINNAGYGLSGGFEKYSASSHAEMMHVNMVSLVKLTSLFLPMLKQQPQSYILNMASNAAYQAVPFLGTYAASKSFVVSFSRALQYELKKTNVSVTCISPGGANTDFGTRANIGKRAIKAGEKFNMEANEVAAVAVNAMFKKKKEVVVGFVNKLGAFLVWLTPKGLSEKIAAKLYE